MTNFINENLFIQLKINNMPNTIILIMGYEILFENLILSICIDFPN